jgi:hypothetical protein
MRQSPKNSQGPSAKAIFAICSLRTTPMIALRKDPQNEAMIPMESARPALPFLVIGYPSQTVATEEGDPGMPRRTEPMKPPEHPPFHRLMRKMIADPGVMVKVIGMQSMTAIDPFKPGMAPKTMPTMVPATKSARLYGSAN